MKPSILFELCAESLDACLAASAGGADRIEICRALEVGGLTPGHEFITQAVRRSGLPVHVLLRPHAHGFLYSGSDFAAICDDIEHARNLGAAGVVLGVLRADRTVDIDRTRELVERTAPLEVTFHRAVDETPDLDRALDDVIAAGCCRVLTSGGAPDVLAGSTTLAGLVNRSAGRIDVAVGGGLRLANAQRVAHLTGARHFHGSLRECEDSSSTLAERVQAVVKILHESRPGAGFLS